MDATPNNKDRFTNSTQIPNWNTDVGGTIPPLERWSPDLSGGESTCETHFCVSGGAPCVPWTQPYTANTFSHTAGDQVNFAVANPKGFKNVMARRTPHGCFGWISSCVDCPTEICADGSTRSSYQGSPDPTKYLVMAVDVAFHASDVNPDSSVNWSVDATASGSRTVNAQTGEVSSTLSTSEIDKDAGSGTLITTKNVTNGADSVTGAPSGQSTVLDAVVATDLHCLTPPTPTVPDGTAFGGEPSLIQAISDWNTESATPGSFSTAFPAPTDPNNYDETVNVGNGLGVVGSFRISWHRTATVFSWDVEGQETTTEFDPDGNVVGTGDTQRYSFTGTITLSSPNTFASVYADVITLLNEWPLNDDALYPWRTDLKVSLAPLVTRNEVVGIASPTGFNPYTIDDLRFPINDPSGNAPGDPSWTPTYTQTAWKDGNVWSFTFADDTQIEAGGAYGGSTAATDLLQLKDGSIVGAPEPAGYENYFQWGFQDVRGCCFEPADNPGEHSWDWYPVGYGQAVGTFNSNTGCNLPLNATQWNNWPEAANKPQGAWVIYADQGQAYYPPACNTSPTGSFDAGQIVACKYAEILETWPSQNFARPAGADKFLLDENHVFCATNVSGAGAGSTWNVTDPVTGNPVPDGTDVSGIWGSNAVGGFYSGNTLSGGVLTIGAKVYDLPTGWQTRSNGDGANCIGKLRFPDCPSLLGRIGITTDLTDDPTGKTFSFASSQPNFGLDQTTAPTPGQEQVDIYDASMTLLASNVTASPTTPRDDGKFMLAAAYSTAAYVLIHGAPAYYFNDSDPKYDFVLLQWWSDFRNGINAPSEYTRLGGALDCDGVTPMAMPSSITYNPAGNGLTAGDVADCDLDPESVTVSFPTNGYAKFCQTPGCVPISPCGPRVVCISPNGEVFGNRKPYPFPASLQFDEQYGNKWWAFVQSTMTDLFWQAPHRPCNIDTCDTWQMDDGSCTPDDVTGGPCPDAPSTYYYALTPIVEARISLPNNYGAAQNETPPALPSGIQIGWLSPVNHTGGAISDELLLDGGDVAFPPAPPGVLEDQGKPAGALTTWNIHSLLCGHSPPTDPSCRFGYTTNGC